MSELIKSARLFANGDHQRIAKDRNPALQGIHAHLKSVAEIVSSVTQDEETIAAAWLHDIIEDASVTVCDLERQFGSGVAKLVGDLTVPMHSIRSDYSTRLALAKKHLVNASTAAKTIKLADFIDTCSDLHKHEPASLTQYASTAKELLNVLEGGDPRLLLRLRRDLDQYTSGSPALEQPKGSPLKPVSIPVAALRVFERALTAKDIAEPLVSFDSRLSANEILETMSVAGVEVAGLHKDGVLWGFVDVSGLPQEGRDAIGREFAPSQVVLARSSFTSVIEVLSRHDRCFVNAFGTIAGVISRVDLHKPAVRMWLFGIVTVAETEFTERVRRKWPNDSWVSLLSTKRLERAMQLHAERERRKQSSQLLDCLQLSDKIEILMSDPSELAAFEIPTASAARRVAKHIESLRNSLAHARDFVDQDWPQIVRFARRIQQMVDGS